MADITYIRLRREFVFLAVILDAFSRKVVGWELDRTLAARLPIAALQKAIGERKPPPGVVHFRWLISPGSWERVPALPRKRIPARLWRCR